MDENQNLGPDMNGTNPNASNGQQSYTNAQPNQQYQQPQYQQPQYQQPNYQQPNYQQPNYQQPQYQQLNYQQPPFQQPFPPQPPLGYNQKSKMAAGLLGIFLGGLGVHNFYLGFTGKAVAQLLITLVAAPIISVFTCGIGAISLCAAPIWGLIEGIMILSSNNPVDANGIPLSN